MWPTFQRASGTTSPLSLINISISNSRNSDLGIIFRHIRRDEQITAQGERPLSPPTLISHSFVYIAAGERRYTTDVEVKAKDNAGPLGQGQVCFYFRQRDDLFKPSNLVTSTASKRSQRLGEPTLCCFTHVTKLDTACARTRTSVGTVGPPLCACHHREICLQVIVRRSGRKRSLSTSLCQSATSGANKHSKQQSPNVTLAVFPSFLAVLRFIGTVRAGSGWPQSARTPAAFRVTC